MTSSSITLTAASLDLLLSLIADSGNWSNNPMLDLGASEKGNFTDLKKKELVRSMRSDGIDFAVFKFTTGQIVTDGARSYSLKNDEYHSEALKN
jgi:hypothetical protein